MALLASLFIRIVGRTSARRFEDDTKDPAAAQLRVLQQILQANRETEYGREHSFASVRDLRSYQESAPVARYEDLRERIDRVAKGAKRVLTAEDPVIFAQTSGTTGEPKLIPVTPTCRGRVHNQQIRTWFYHALRDHPGIFSGKVMSLVSPAVEGKTEAGIPYGSTSGMMYRDMNPLVRSVYAIPYAAFEIKDYESQYYAVTRLGLAQDVTFFATANPSSVLKLAETADANAERLIRDIRDGTLSDELKIEPEIRRELTRALRPDPQTAARLEEARSRRGGKLLPADYWPHLALIACWKGGTVKAAVEQVGEWFDPERRGAVPVRDWGYLSSEARGSVPLSDDGDSGVLTIGTNVFEFVSADELDERPDDRQGWKFLGAHEIEEGSEYYVFLTTTGGLYRYDINDVIAVTGMYNRTPVISFRRKGRGMASITGEKLSANQVTDAVAAAGKSLDLPLEHFRAEPDVDNARYVFKVELDESVGKQRGKELLQSIDEKLSEANVEYKAKRASKRLKSPVLQVMKSGWSERDGKRQANDGKLFQSKEVVLDSKQPFHPEPDDVAVEVALDEAS